MLPPLVQKGNVTQYIRFLRFGEESNDGDLQAQGTCVLRVQGHQAQNRQSPSDCRRHQKLPRLRPSSKDTPDLIKSCSRLYEQLQLEDDNFRAFINMGSRAKIARHPVHPMLVPFVIAFFILAFVFDVLYKIGWVSREPGVQFPYYLLIAGIAMALAAAIPAIIDYHSIESEEAMRTATVHATLNSVLLLLQIVNLAMRARHKSHEWRDGWILSLVSVALLSVSGWMGQKLVYEHGVGVSTVEEKGERINFTRSSI